MGVGRGVRVGDADVDDAADASVPGGVEHDLGLLDALLVGSSSVAHHDSEVGEAVCPPMRPLRDADTQELDALITPRSQQMTILIEENNRWGRAIYPVAPTFRPTSRGWSGSCRTWTRA